MLCTNRVLKVMPCSIFYKLNIVGNICNINYLHSLEYVDDTGLITERGKTITKALFRNNRSFTPPTTDDIKQLANQFREFFPKGVKTNNHPVRGNMTNIIRKMRKFKTEFTASPSNSVILLPILVYTT